MAAVLDTEDLRRQAAAPALRIDEEVESTMDDSLKQVVAEIRATIPTLATKLELNHAISEVKGEISALRLEMKDGFAAFSASTAALRGEMKDGLAAASASVAALRCEMKDGFA